MQDCENALDATSSPIGQKGSKLLLSYQYIFMTLGHSHMTRNKVSSDLQHRILQRGASVRSDFIKNTSHITNQTHLN